MNVQVDDSHHSLCLTYCVTQEASLKMGLETHIISSSERGLSSVTTLIVGSKAAAIIDPPFLIPDANAVVEMAKKKLSVPLKAVFVTHHHPDHYFSANPILDAFPESRLYAAPYGKSVNRKAVRVDKYDKLDSFDC